MAEAIKTQFRNLPLLATTETCLGGNYIVTGANTGLGFEAAKHLVALGAAKVIMGVRNVGAGETAKGEIETATGKANVAAVWVLDLTSYNPVKAFAKMAVAELDRIDAFIENAGIAVTQWLLAEGHLISVTVNVLSMFLLAVLLLPKMTEDARTSAMTPHIVFATSRVSFDAKEDWNQIKDDPLVKMDDEKMVLLKTYPLTKLLEVMTVRHLAALLPVARAGVVMNLICPGLCKTDLSRRAPPAFRENLAIQTEIFAWTAEDGSRTLLYRAVARKESHGCFLESCRIAE